MKYVKAIFVAIVVAAIGSLFEPPARADLPLEVARAELSPHGTWFVSAQYGQVWRPRGHDRSWNPYHDGHWVRTDMGWAWISSYEWGAIPYHYGTWIVDRYEGWVWIPGSVWAPSWVLFRVCPDYIGWAPVPPNFSVGAPTYVRASSAFVYVASSDFLAPRLRSAIIADERANQFSRSTSMSGGIALRNGIVVNEGPDVRSVERATGRTVREERIESVAGIAPFAPVSRTRLAVDLESRTRDLRAAEPVGEVRVVPDSAAASSLVVSETTFPDPEDGEKRRAPQPR